MDISLIAPPEPFKALIFDCDGTLVDTMPNHYVAWSAALATYGASFTREKFYAMGGMSSVETIEQLNREFGFDLDVEKTHEEKDRHYLETLHTAIEIKAVVDIARAYQGKVPIAVGTGATRRIVEATLDAVNLGSLFDAVAAADEVVHCKPAPDVFLLAAERLGVAPEDCIVYEDGDVGIEAAKRAGMRYVDVRVLWEK